MVNLISVLVMIMCEKERVLIVCRKRKSQRQSVRDFFKRGFVRSFVLSDLGISTLFISQLNLSCLLDGTEACG